MSLAYGRSLAAALTALVLLFATACSGDDGTADEAASATPTPGAAILEGALGLVTDEATQVTVWDGEAIRSDAPRELENKFEEEAESLEEFGIFSEDVTRVVEMSDDQAGDEVVILEGQFEWEEVQDALADLDYEDSTYRDQELWEDDSGFGSFALLEDRGQIVGGAPPGAVRGLLRSLKRGTGFLLQDPEHDLTRVLQKAGDGWLVLAEDDCGPIDARGCRAVAQTVSWSADQSTLEVRWVVLFRRESTAESELDAVEDYFDEALPRAVDVESVEQDGEFVILTASVDEDDYAVPESAADADVATR